MVSWWGKADLAYKFAIVLGVALVLTFGAAFLRLWVITKRTARIQLQEDLERANLTNEKVGIKRELGVGDLFGVRALEKGHYGGVSQVDLLFASGAIPVSESRTNTSSASDQVAPVRRLSASSSVEPKTIPSSARHRVTVSSGKCRAEAVRPVVADIYGFQWPEPPNRRRSSTSTFLRRKESKEATLSMPKRAYDPLPTQRRKSWRKGAPAPIDVKAASLAPIRLQSPRLKSPTLSIFPTSPRRIPRKPIPSPIFERPKAESIRSFRSSSSKADSSRPPRLREMSAFSNWGESLLNDLMQPRQSWRISRPPLPSKANSSRASSRKSLKLSSSANQQTVRIPRKPLQTAEKMSTSRSSSSSRRMIDTANSIRTHKRRNSSKDDTERDRDILHYDPSPDCPRTRAGSIQGHPVDFDAQRDSPFSENRTHASKPSEESASGSSIESEEPKELELDEESLQRENERMIQQWKSRELKKALRAARESGVLGHHLGNTVTRKSMGVPALPAIVLDDKFDN